jgi:hypothetical protein
MTGQGVTIVVQNPGEGIAFSDLAHVFDRFYALTAAGRRLPLESPVPRLWGFPPQPLPHLSRPSCQVGSHAHPFIVWISFGQLLELLPQLVVDLVHPAPRCRSRFS